MPRTNLVRCNKPAAHSLYKVMSAHPLPHRTDIAAWPTPSFWGALARGAGNRCPACGQGRLFRGYLRLAERCDACGAPLGAIRADDAPPYFTIFIVGHLVIPLMLLAERSGAWSPWGMAAVFLPTTLLLALLLLRPIKGATVGLMMRFGITGREGDPRRDG
jgi:uncharacterized protein (DUF983 family)